MASKTSRGLRGADQIADFPFRHETFSFHARYRDATAANWVKVMSQRLKVQEMVMQMHEKNLVLVNILRDIVENETDCDMCMEDDDDEEFWRKLSDRASRRAEIVAAIKHFLRRENLAMQVSA